MKIINFAIELEKVGKEYFEKLAAESTMEGMKRIFTMLADEQQELYDTFRAMKSAGLPGCEADSATLDRARDSFDRIFADDGGTIGMLKNDLDAYRHALMVESNIVEFFEDMATRENDHDARMLLSEIAEEERKHYDAVENIYDFVAAPRTHLDWAEFSNLKEM